jgi:hypothetical protein
MQRSYRELANADLQGLGEVSIPCQPTASAVFFPDQILKQNNLQS